MPSMDGMDMAKKYSGYGEWRPDADGLASDDEEGGREGGVKYIV